MRPDPGTPPVESARAAVVGAWVAGGTPKNPSFWLDAVPIAAPVVAPIAKLAPSGIVSPAFRRKPRPVPEVAHWMRRSATARIPVAEEVTEANRTCADD